MLILTDLIVIALTKDTKLAFYWYSQVAESGYSTAQFNLAELYDSGVGTEKKPNLVVLLYCHFLHPY
jgi:TPR repeat protein